MNERDFCYWLQGYFELNGAEELSAKQVEIVREHLQLVLNKVTRASVDLSSRTFVDVPTHLTC